MIDPIGTQFVPEPVVSNRLNDTSSLPVKKKYLYKRKLLHPVNTYSTIGIYGTKHTTH